MIRDITSACEREGLIVSLAVISKYIQAGFQ
jgi:hypothetical protein